MERQRGILGATVRGLHLAHAFLTALPLPHVGEVREGEFRTASGFYPAVGWTLGALLVALSWLLGSLPEGVRAALVLGAWLALTGMLHFDGLVDAGDALPVAASPRRRLEILSDVHVGAFGLATGVVLLLVKWSALAASPEPVLLLAAPVIARAAVLLPMSLYPAARADGLGARSREGNWPVGLAIALPAILLAPASAAAALAVALVVAAFAARRLGGGINGDVYGAVVEVAEAAALVAAVASAA